VRGELRQEATLTIQPRFSLRTILEIVFVVAVVLMLVYQTVKPAAAPVPPSPLVGRYQLENAGTNEPFLVERRIRRTRLFTRGSNQPLLDSGTARM
jgi:hypothetical protein